jgi:membrane associated rhomboid family serine protease
VVTKVLVAANLAVLFLELTTGGALWPTTEISDVEINGALIGAPIAEDGEWWRILTSGFLHRGVPHLALNMVLLWLLGGQLEGALGSIRFTILYFGSLFAGAFGALLVDPTALTIGASGAIFGLMGAAVAAQRASGISPWKSGIGGLVLINLVFTFYATNISVGGHVGGLIGGYLIGWIFYETPKRFPQPWLPYLGAVSVGLVSLAGALWAATTWTDPLF